MRLSNEVLETMVVDDLKYRFTEAAEENNADLTVALAKVTCLNIDHIKLRNKMQKVSY